MINLILFILGASLGSFINVLAIRYNPDKFLLSKEIISGRSKCRSCHKELQWFGLIPIISFIIQKGKCRNCKTNLTLQYPLIEILCGLIFVFTYNYFQNIFFVLFLIKPTLFNFYFVTSIWILILLTLVLITLIDLKLQIIPNETLIFILILGIVLNIFMFIQKPMEIQSFILSYSLLFGFKENFLINKLISIGFALIFFSSLIIITFGKGIGVGDLKLMIALSIIVNWPDILLISILSFLIGAIFGLFFIVTKRKTIKSAIPFGPFISIAVYLTIFYGEEVLKIYFDIGNKLFLNI